ncbi:coiled-coil domain-containing protein 61 [Paragonimus westermani]|uniref:Coiled-coil domain-containing protein 61 n=1 Tax=Paragonimus westermani TaxID=34504 RepID=A0A5J4NT37_9TREM|nr:coiled-coil domain-containing protein 61 [Paragonimus westermani]
MALSFPPCVSVTKEFRGVHFEVQSFLKDFHCLHLELRDKNIEELTRKTGSFKRFQIFVCMLQNALTQPSETLHLDVVSYGDLEILRRNKSNGTSFNENLSFNRDKRFLILTYVTEFDKIHYPLPLNYVGSVSVDHLNNMIRELRLELCRIKFNGKMCPSSPCGRSGSDQTAEVVRLQEQNKKLVQEIYRLQAQPILQAHPLNLLNDSCTQAPTAHDIRSLVDNLENELFEEKSKAAREATRHRQEVSRLRAELDASNSCQRSLNRRVEQLTKELILFKRG